MTFPERRQAAIREALTWQRTPFDYGQCVKGAGVDCGRFAASALNAGRESPIDIAKLPRLSPQWFMHREDGSFVDQIKLFAEEYSLGSDKPIPDPADLVIAKCGRDWAHLALVIQWPRVIGAAMEHVVTIWDNIYRSPQYMNRHLRFFDPWRPKSV